MFLTQPSRYETFMASFRPLLKDEKIEVGDIVEDLQSGTREVITRKRTKGFYSFLRGTRAGAALELPGIHQILRKV